MTKYVVCIKCKKEKEHKARGFCKSCYRSPSRKCIKCKKIKRIFGHGLCKSCYQEPQRKCSRCDRIEKMATKILCKKCYKTAKEKCHKCNQIEHIFKRENGPICQKCYVPPEDICSVCGKMNTISKRNGSVTLCSSCYNKQYNRPIGLCSVCNNICPLKIRKNGNICEKCYVIPKKECVICHKLRKPIKKMGDGTICRNCYRKEKYKNNQAYRIKKRIQSRIKDAVLNLSYKKSKHGIDYEGIIKKLSPIPQNIDDYHIDHIFPLSAFDFTKPNHIVAAFAPENHQWLLKDQNMKKNDHYNKSLFDLYIKKYEFPED